MGKALARPRPPLMNDELVRRLGGVPLSRICLDPPPGRATEADVLRFLHAADKRLFELVDGTLVEKPMGQKESFLAFELAYRLKAHSMGAGNLGMILGPDGTVRLYAGSVRIPDVAFTFWDRLPGRRVPQEPITGIAPDLAVEVLSPSNRAGEMRRKLDDYFGAGVRVVWFVRPASESARVHTGPAAFVDVPPDGAIDGGDLLPGFRLVLKDFYAELAPEPPKPRKKKPRG